MENTEKDYRKEIKYKIVIIKIFKILDIIFVISSIGSFVSALIYHIMNNVENLALIIFGNIGFLLIYRIVLAAFFFCFAIFIEEWLKTDD
jgi:hypothetical protein